MPSRLEDYALIGDFHTAALVARDGSIDVIDAGYRDEAKAWRDWLLRAVAGKASQLKIMYGLMGERRLTEIELGWLPGHEDSRPVRIGNAAHEHFQMDVYGELMDVSTITARSPGDGE